MTQRRNSSSRGGSADTLARGLGWFSIALGVTEVVGARTLARTLGMEGHETLLRAYGVREIATGIGILSAKDPTPWIWGRVAGDALDLATLAPALSHDNRERGNVALVLGTVAAVTALDVVCAQRLGAEGAQQPALPPPWDYSDRSGLPRPPEQMRGAARDFEVPRDMRIPELMRPYT